MADPLFDQDKCPVPFIPASDFRFISDCQILPPPLPIFDCPDIEIPFDPPPPPIPRICIPCPVFEAAGTVVVLQGEEPAVTITITPTTSNPSCASDPSCGFLFDFDFVLPIPACPTITAAATIQQIGSVAEIDFTVTPAGGDSCAFDFDLNIVVPVTGAAGPAGPPGADGANGANGADGSPGATGPQGPPCANAGEADCTLWIWCPTCEGSEDSNGDPIAGWLKADGTAFMEGDPPQPTWDGRMAGEAVITCHCPPCESLSSVSLSSVSVSDVSMGCCPNEFPAVMYAVIEDHLNCPCASAVITLEYEGSGVWSGTGSFGGCGGDITVTFTMEFITLVPCKVRRTLDLSFSNACNAGVTAVEEYTLISPAECPLTWEVAMAGFGDACCAGENLNITVTVMP